MLPTSWDISICDQKSKEKTWCPKSEAKIQAFDEFHWISWSLCPSPDVLHELGETSMCSHHPYFLTWAWFSGDHTTFSNHAVILRPLCLLACPQILTVYLRVLRRVLRFTKPVKCLLKTTDDAKIKTSFLNAVVYSSLHPFGESQLIFVGQRPV